MWFIKKIFIVTILLLSAFACKKDIGFIPKPVVTPVLPDTTKPRMYFVFVNRTGYKNDTTAVKWLQAVNLYNKFYNPKTNSSNLAQTIYNRNYSAFQYRLSDSIIHMGYVNLTGAQYAYEIRIHWYSSLGVQFGREIRFNTKNWPNACDTIEVARDTVIKFIYPQDTLPNNKFVRVY